MKSRLLIVAIVLGLAGCVAGQNIRLQYTPPPGASANSVTAVGVKVVVTDKRQYVVSGEKRPEYIGHYRAGFGNTWDVVNFNKVALATQMSTDLQAELQSLGFANGGVQAGKSLTITINEWNFDAMSNGRFWYDIRLTINNTNGAELYATQAKNEKIIDGSVMTGAKYAMQKQIPVIYGDIIRAFVRDNPAAMSALKK